MPPGRPPGGTGNSAASSRILPAKPLDGTVVCQRFCAVMKVVVAEVAEGLKVTLESGTETVYVVPFALNVIVEFRTKMVTGLVPRPDGFSTLLNQI